GIGTAILALIMLLWLVFTAAACLFGAGLFLVPWGLSSIHRDHPPLPRGAVAAGLQLPPSVGTRPRGTSVQRLSVRTIMVRG
ncbi:hypothetical protein ABZ737_32465, partial [Streptomyces sp. NPDC013087]